MCIVAAAVNAHPRFKVVVASNRDEFVHRPTQPCSLWTPAAPATAAAGAAAGVGVHRVLSSVDGEKGGIWLGLTESGRVSTVTNFQDHTHSDALLSRGQLCLGFLTSAPGVTAAAYCADVMRGAPQRYNAFNLLCIDAGARDSSASAWFASNRSAAAMQNAVPLSSRVVHTLSNAQLDAVWPKQMRLGSRVQSILTRDAVHGGDDDDDDDDDSEGDGGARALALELLEALGDSERFPEHNRGEMTRVVDVALSSVFCSVPRGRYGTRTSTVVLVDNMQRATYVERNYATLANGGTDRSTYTDAWFMLDLVE